MRPRGKCFDGSDSMFRTQQDMVKRAGHAVWLNEFTPAVLEYLAFVNRLMQTLCELDICCVLVNAYPAYIAGVLSVFSTGGIRLSLLYIARTDSPIVDNIYKNVPSFQVGPFTFALSASQDKDINPDYNVYALIFGEDTVELLIGLVDVTDNCGSRSSINLMEFMWESTIIFAFTKYWIVCVPLDSPKVLYLLHHGTSSVGWTQDALCRPCFGTIGIESTLSYPSVRTRARAGVMCVSDNPHLCEVWSPTRYSTLLIILLNSRSPLRLFMITILGLPRRKPFPSTG